MVHFLDWTTSSSVFAGNQGNSPFLTELVAHFLEWSTDSFVFAENQGNSPVWSELVVHFLEWSTGSFVFAGNQGNSPVWWKLVDHWLHTKKPARRACWLAIRLENLLGQALPLGLNQVALLAVVDAHAGVP